MSSQSIETRSQINLSVFAINCLRVQIESGESRDVTKSAEIELQSNAHTNDSGDARMGVDMGKFAQVGRARKLGVEGNERNDLDYSRESYVHEKKFKLL